MTTAVATIPKVRFNKKTDFVSLEKYFREEEIALHKREYHNGKVIKMAGGTALHDNLATKAAKLIDNFIEDNDLFYIVNGSETKISIPAYNKIVYPDALVIMERPIYFEGRKDTITNPLIVVEVLSKSTEKYDKETKFEYYRSIDTFKEYVMIFQDTKKVAVYTKQQDNTWIIQFYEGDEATAILHALHECPISLKRLYRNMELI
jgi:Uma2 family endonuclease